MTRTTSTPRSQPRGDSALLRILLAEASRRGWTLDSLAGHLGISYRALAHYRQGISDIANANRTTLQGAADVLGVPVAAVHLLAGRLTPDDFLFPGRGSPPARIRQELEQLRADPLYGAFAPEELLDAAYPVQRLVAVLYRELEGGSQRAARLPEYMRLLHHASLANASAEASLLQLRRIDEQDVGAL